MNKNNISLTRQHAVEIERLERREALFLKCSKAVFIFGLVLTAVLMAGILLNVVTSHVNSNAATVVDFSSRYTVVVERRRGMTASDPTSFLSFF